MTSKQISDIHSIKLGSEFHYILTFDDEHIFKANLRDANTGQLLVFKLAMPKTISLTDAVTRVLKAIK